MSYKELCEKVGVSKVSVTKYCDQSCSACGGYDNGEIIGVELCKDVLIYPKFTAEKREALEELILNFPLTNYLSYKKSLEGYYCQWLGMGDVRMTGKGKTRKDALCSLFYMLLDPPPQLDKKLINPEDVKEILK